jgi:hypothetical protein
MSARAMTSLARGYTLPSWSTGAPRYRSAASLPYALDPGNAERLEELSLRLLS